MDRWDFKLEIMHVHLEKFQSKVFLSSHSILWPVCFLWVLTKAGCGCTEEDEEEEISVDARIGAVFFHNWMKFLRYEMNKERHRWSSLKFLLLCGLALARFGKLNAVAHHRSPLGGDACHMSPLTPKGGLHTTSLASNSAAPNANEGREMIFFADQSVYTGSH